MNEICPLIIRTSLQLLLCFVSMNFYRNVETQRMYREMCDGIFYVFMIQNECLFMLTTLSQCSRQTEHLYFNIYLDLLSDACMHAKLFPFSSVTQSCPTLCVPMNCSTPGLPVHHQLPEFPHRHLGKEPLFLEPRTHLSL